LLTLYICLGYLAAPLLLAHGLWRGIGAPGEWARLGERLGRCAGVVPGGIWVHAVSVGEVQAAAVLVRALRERHPTLPLLVTCGTATGRARAEALYAGVALVRYLPWDLPDAVARFLGRVRPRLGIVVETELWPNLYRAARRRGVPLLVASARLSARSVARYRPLRRLTRDALASVTVAAQTSADAARFVAIGAEPARVHVTGNLKFDFEVPSGAPEAGALERARLGTARPVWVAGSTHEGEEEQLLAAHAALRRLRPDALLVLAPRHPPRFAAAAALVARSGLAAVRRTDGGPVRADTAVLVLDTLGELLTFYAAGDVAVGGHNLLEPAALGRCVLAGPHTANAGGSDALLEAAGGLVRVRDAATLATALAALLADPGERARRGRAGEAIVAANRGALARVLGLLAPAAGA
jgi:3-deoxy-D-manno-octulosonic-acid transferase